jgi:Ser/Thr protein kinase RdoA (MazF antagonist)
VSTQVYRLERGSEVFFLRIGEEEQDNLETDAELHRRLHSMGVHVPTVIYVEPFNDALSRSVMITTEISGSSLDNISAVEAAAGVARAAGRDLALLNQIPVRGFGFVLRRPPHWPLVAEFASYAEFVVSYLPHPWPGALAHVFTLAEIERFAGAIDREWGRPLAEARLAHGDFDLTPIFQLEGSYRGIIDFGEIRGAEPSFDLGHFLLHDGESLPVPLFDHLAAGYEEIQSPLPPLTEVQRSAILLGLRQLCRWLARGEPTTTRRVQARVVRLRELTAAGDAA